MIKDIMATPHSNHPKAVQLIDRKLKRYQRNQPATEFTLPWDADFFKLNQSKLFVGLDQDQQGCILQALCLSLIMESYGIEKIGISYCGKLANIAPTIEERQMFSLIGADEATHLHWLTPYVPIDLRTTYMSPFLAFMGKMIDLEVPNILYFLIQILLEGWSIHHYKSLYRHCLDSELKSIIRHILQDESNHHQSGKVFFDASLLSSKDKNLILEYLQGYLEVLQLGGPHIVHTVDSVAKLSPDQKKALYQDLEIEATTQAKLALFKGLIRQPGLESLVDQLEQVGAFACETKTFA